MFSDVNKQTLTFVSEMLRSYLILMGEKSTILRSHSERVALNCMNFSKKIKIEKNEIDKLYVAGLLHDIGLVIMPQPIIDNIGQIDKLTPEELNLYQQHPQIAEKVLMPYAWFKGILPLILYHHVYLDGTGFPKDLHLDKSYIGIKILTLINTYDLIAYPFGAQPKDMNWAFEQIERMSETQLDKALVHEFITYLKPSKAADITPEPTLDIMDIIYEILDELKQEKIALPVLPKVVQDVQMIINKPDYTIDELTGVIEKDSAMSLRMIAVANSPYYSGVARVNTVRKAITRVGFTEVLSIVLAIANKGQYQTKNPLYKSLMEKQWLHSLACAYAARSIAERKKYTDKEEYFSIGMMHDIGKVVLLRYITEKEPEKYGISITQIISGIIKSYMSISGMILRHWRFGKRFIRAATMQEGLLFDRGTDKAVLVINVANAIACKAGYAVMDEVKEFSTLESAKLLGLSVEVLEYIKENIQTNMAELEKNYNE
ncbi:MAG: HDOD domain-containing protein [Desulfobacterales bacterium]|nr:HDOD domain-containing protein [Desulfobacterales bacterium]